MSPIYSTSTGDKVRAPSEFSAQFTVITAAKVYRVRAVSEAKVRSAFTAANIPVLAIDRDAED